MFFLWILTLLDAALAELLLPAPCGAQDFLGRRLGLPAKYLVGLVDITPNLLDIALATWSVGPVNLYASGLLEALYNLEG